MDLLSTKHTKFSQRQVNESKKISDILNDITGETKVLTEGALIQQESAEENMFLMSSNKKAREKRIETNRKNQFLAESNKQLTELALVKIVSESLLMDPKAKELNNSYITEQVKGVTEYLFEMGLLDHNKSVTMNNILESISATSYELYEVRDNVEEISKLESAFDAELNPTVSYIAECVQQKVADVVRSEREFSNILTESTTDVKFKGNDTLFKTIQLENVKMALKEEESSEITPQVMNRAFAETLFDYTLLESLNTLRLVEISGEQMRKTLPRYFKSVSESAKLVKKGKLLFFLTMDDDVTEVLFEIQGEELVKASLITKDGNVKLSEDIRCEMGKNNQVLDFKKEFTKSKLSQKYPKVVFNLRAKDSDKTVKL